MRKLPSWSQYHIPSFSDSRMTPKNWKSFLACTNQTVAKVTGPRRLYRIHSSAIKVSKRIVYILIWNLTVLMSTWSCFTLKSNRRQNKQCIQQHTSSLSPKQYLISSYSMSKISSSSSSSPFPLSSIDTSSFSRAALSDDVPFCSIDTSSLWSSPSFPVRGTSSLCSSS